MSQITLPKLTRLDEHRESELKTAASQDLNHALKDESKQGLLNSAQRHLTDRTTQKPHSFGVLLMMQPHFLPKPPPLHLH